MQAGEACGHEEQRAGRSALLLSGAGAARLRQDRARRLASLLASLLAIVVVLCAGRSVLGSFDVTKRKKKQKDGRMTKLKGGEGGLRTAKVQIGRR